jgi:hypothetical protein
MALNRFFLPECLLARQWGQSGLASHACDEVPI